MTPEQLAARPRVARGEDVVRYAGGSHYDPATGQLNGSAFERNAKDHDGVSVTRRGVFADDLEEDRAQIRRVVGSRLALGARAVFAEINVGALLDSLAEFEQEIFVCHDPLNGNDHTLANPAHALIVGFPFRGEAVGSLNSEAAGDRLRQRVHAIYPAVPPAIRLSE